MEVLKDVGAWEKIIKNSLDIIGTVDKNGIIININEACKSVLGYESSEVTGFSFHSLVHSGDLNLSLGALQNVAGGTKVNNFRNRCIHKNGKEVPISWSAIWSEEEEVILCVGRDLTGQGLAWEKDEFHKALAENGSGMTTLLDKELNYLYSGPSTFTALGYLPEEFIGKNVFCYIHPEDIPMIKESVTKALYAGEENLKISEFRFKNAKGEWRWFESIGSNQLQNPAVKALVVNSCDITERVNDRLKLQASEQRFKSLFDHHLDVVFFQGKDGVVQDVNAAALSFFKVEKEDLLNRPLSDFLSSKVVPDFEQGFFEALSGETVHFAGLLPFEGKENNSFDKGNNSFDIVKIPVIVNDEIIGVYCIFRDVTAIINSNNTIKRQAEKLNIIMESITDAFFTIDKDWKFTYMNSEFEKLFLKDRKEMLGENIVDLYQDEINGKFHRQCQYAMETGKPVEFEAYFKELGIWLQVKAFPSEDGLSVFLNDITEKINSREELEKLSLVASKTTNGVIIMDGEGKTEWVNNGFTKLTGYSFPEVLGLRPDAVLHTIDTDEETVVRISEKLRRKESCSDEMLIIKKSGEKRWICVNITPIVNEAGETTRFIAIQTDITERKEAEESQLRMTNDLFKQNRDLQQFTYIVSHNLRSPVASMMGLAELLITTVDKGSETYDVSLGYLKKTADQLDNVLRDLNQILSIRDKKAASTNGKVELAPVIQQVLATLQEPLNECGGKVLINIEEGASMSGIKGYLYSVFYNLFSNSIKYRHPNRSLEVSIKCSSSDSGVVISFSDNGIGFDLEKVGDNIFKLYKRFHINLEGRGVGLFLVKTHVEAMDGHIEVNSQVNVGTTFLINLK